MANFSLDLLPFFPLILELINILYICYARKVVNCLFLRCIEFDKRIELYENVCRYGRRCGCESGL